MFTLLLACSQPVEAPPAEVVGLAIAPTQATLVTGPQGGEPLQFEAYVTTEGGETQQIEVVDWVVSNLSAGEIDDEGRFVPSLSNGGETWVTARFNGAEAQAEVTVIYEQSIVEDGADPRLFTGAVGDWESAWLYPADGVNIPRNTPSIELQWDDVAALCYKLVLRSETTDLTVFTTAPGWTADAALWTTIAATNAGGQVALTLTAAGADGLAQADPLTINVNRMDANGSIFYWSTSTEGFMEIPYGGEAREFLTLNQTGHCQGCHAISSEGLIAFTYDGGDGALGVQAVDSQRDVLAYNDSFFGNFKDFSPDSDYLVTTFQGALLLYDGRTIEYLGEIPMDEPATHVDWSPVDNRLLVVLHDDVDTWGDWYFTGGSRIAVMEYLGDGMFSAPEVLFDGGDQTAYYPTWSPDGQWIAFNMSTGDAYDDPDAQLWVMSDEGGDPRPLDAANDLGELTNSWPRWGPLPDDDILWLAFGSKRAYGRRSDPALPNPQIWVAGFDPKRARAGQDPSWPAFWLPGQDILQNNHIPLWADP